MNGCVKRRLEKAVRHRYKTLEIIKLNICTDEHNEKGNIVYRAGRGGAQVLDEKSELADSESRET